MSKENILIVLLSFLLVSGCATTQMYEGKARSDSEVAVIIGMNPHDPLIPKGWASYVIRVDGKDTPDLGAKIAVIPGEHTLEVYCMAPGLPQRQSIITRTFEAGAKYGIGVPRDKDTCSVFKR